MSTVTVSGKTIEEAVQKGLSELKVTKDQVTITVLEQPSRGFLGLIGTRPAKVELKLKQPVPANQTRVSEEKAKVSAVSSPAFMESSAVPNSETSALRDQEAQLKQASSEGKTAANGIEESRQFVMEVARTMGLDVDVHVDKKRDHFLFDIAGEDLGLIIGRRGQTLDSLQYLANLVANRYSDQHLRIILDAEQFRERRKQTLEALAERLANKVIRTRKEVVLEPMSPQERKIIHAKLQDHGKVKTYSKGEEPNRRIVISLK